MFIRTFVHLRNPINVRQIELLTIWLYSEWGEDRFVVVQHLWCRKIRQILCRVSRKWMESKFLDQDVDVVSLANKGIFSGCFVGRNYNKILMETGKLTDNIRVTKNGLGSGVDRMFQSSDSAFYHFTDRLNPFGKSVELDILFLGPLPGICFTCIHDNIKCIYPLIVFIVLKKYATQHHLVFRESWPSSYLLSVQKTY